jgi:hypothetical protein
MKVCARRFNIYFTLALVLVTVCGCQTGKKKDKPEDRVGALRVHLEARDEGFGTSQTISMMQRDPVQVTIARDPILTEAGIIRAEVIDAPGGFAVQIRFDESSALSLEQFSASNQGRHFVIFGQWGDKAEQGRWLAAPLITQRISNGTLAFTPDATRAETDQLVLGLNNVARNLHKGDAK